MEGVKVVAFIPFISGQMLHKGEKGAPAANRWGRDGRAQVAARGARRAVAPLPVLLQDRRAALAIGVESGRGWSNKTMTNRRSIK